MYMLAQCNVCFRAGTFTVPSLGLGI